MSNQTLRHNAAAAVKSAFKADSENAALAALTHAALSSLRGGRGLSVEARQKRVADAVAVLTAAQAVTESADAKGSLGEAVTTLGEVTFPESTYVAPTYPDFDTDYDEDVLSLSDDDDEE